MVTGQVGVQVRQYAVISRIPNPTRAIRQQGNLDHSLSIHVNSQPTGPERHDRSWPKTLAPRRYNAPPFPTWNERRCKSRLHLQQNVYHVVFPRYVLAMDIIFDHWTLRGLLLRGSPLVS